MKTSLTNNLNPSRTLAARLFAAAVLLLLLALPAAVQAQYLYTTNNDTITIVAYTGSGGAVMIPSAILGRPVTRIGDNAFSGSAVTSITIPNSVTGIEMSSFYNCTSLTNASIGNSVARIGDLTFYGCTSLMAITVDPLNSSFSSADGVLFDKSQTKLIQYPGGKAGSYTIPDNVTNIAYYAFLKCTNLTSVSIPNSVTSIGFDAFWGCTSLMAITVDPLNSSFSSVDVVLFDKSQTKLIQYPGGKAGSYTIPDSVTNIGNYAFAGSAVTSVTIPASVTSIGEGMFESCTSLTSVTIPNSVTFIGKRTFYNCTSLTGVYFQGNAPRVGPYVFTGDNNATIYYLPGTTGWGSMLAGPLTALWQPAIQVNHTSFGVRTNQFGFTITWASGKAVVVEACTNLANPIWFPLQTNTLTGGSSYFSDPDWTSYPARFYRLRSP